MTRNTATTSYILLLMTIVMAACHVDCLAGGRSRKASAQKPSFTVVIDAGHGGKDYGCIGDKACEKNITLAVARLLDEKVRRGCPDTRSVLTRDDDRFLTLQQRADIANREKGDLFVSIHVNSVDKRSKGRRSVQGASVYALGADKAANTLGVAMRENSVMELEDDYTTAYRGFDPNSAESYIIFELSNNLHLNQSLDFADMAQAELTGYAGRLDKGVRQAGFWVLWATGMPAVLVELDFICNPVQEEFLASDEGREKCAEALYRAIDRYRSTYVRQMHGIAAKDRTASR